MVKGSEAWAAVQCHCRTSALPMTLQAYSTPRIKLMPNAALTTTHPRSGVMGRVVMGAFGPRGRA